MDGPRVVIVGCGFGGLWAVRTLARASVHVLVVDRNNFHTFFPLLYQVAAAEQEPEHIAYPIREILREMPSAQFALATVTEIDLDRQTIATDDSTFHYDFLILTTGSTSHYFDIPGAAEHSFPLRTMNQAIALRNHILSCFERAVQTKDIESRKRLLTFIIVGGGPTGVEFAGGLAELIYRPLKRDYPTLDFQEVRVIVLEAADSLLHTFPQKIRTYAQSRLIKKGIDVQLKRMVTEVSPTAVFIKDGQPISTETVVWTAGLHGDPNAKAWGLPTNWDGRVTVQPTLQVATYPNVYVVGDLAYCEDAGHPLPMVAPVAVQQGTQAAQNILRELSGKPPQPFHYRDRGMMVVIGRNSAAVHLLNRWTIMGFTAWFLWLSAHIFHLIGFRNRIFVMVNWALDYFLYERKVKLILPGPPS